MKWKTKEHKGHHEDEIRIIPVFTWWPKKAWTVYPPQYNQKETRWFTFDLLAERYYSASIYDTTNVFGAKKVGVVPSFWGSATWLDTRGLTIKEKLYALMIALRNATSALVLVGGLLYGFGFSVNRIYELTQELNRLHVEQEEQNNTINKRFEELKKEAEKGN